MSQTAWSAAPRTVRLFHNTHLMVVAPFIGNDIAPVCVKTIVLQHVLEITGGDTGKFCDYKAGQKVQATDQKNPDIVSKTERSGTDMIITLNGEVLSERLENHGTTVQDALTKQVKQVQGCIMRHFGEIIPFFTMFSDAAWRMKGSGLYEVVAGGARQKLAPLSEDFIPPNWSNGQNGS